MKQQARAGAAEAPRAAGLARGCHGRNLVLAWAYNLLFGLVSLVALVALSLGVAQSDSHAEKLQASGMTLEAWWRAVGFAFAWTLAQSLVIVDGLKVVCLTVSSPVFMHRLPAGSLRRFVSTNLLRNAHKMLEAAL